MVLESTMICVDNSDYMRNGDFLPTRLQAQQDAVNLVCHSKTRSNPENNVGLLTLANVEVLATLTSDVGRILSKLHQVQPFGDINLHTGIRIAHLALKHRQGKNHKMRIVAFVGSPVAAEEKELVKLAKKLKKEKVSVDVISFGEDSVNNDVLTSFVNTLNGKDGTGSHLVTVPPGPHLSDALISSPVIQGEDGSGATSAIGFEFGVDPNEDPELALATPYFLLFILLENLLLWLENRSTLRLNDSITSMSHGMLQQCGRLLWRGAEGWTYVYIYENFRFFEAPWDSWYTWYAAAIGIDFCYYWVHRACHEVHIFWAQHQVHHSSEEYNLTTALRQSLLQGWCAFIFYLPLAFVIPPSHFVAHQQFNLLYQFWIHTQAIKTLGPLEFVLNTPKHHRVHHGSNLYCLDKNYGGVLIIWDRIFGTFAEERPNEEIIYGLVFNQPSFNPIHLQSFYTIYVIKKFQAMTTWKDKLAAIFYGPSWQPGKPRLGLDADKPNIRSRKKYHVELPVWCNVYLLAHFTIMVLGYQELTCRYMGMNPIIVFGLVIYIVASLTNIGLLFENKPYACVLELLRCALLVTALQRLDLSDIDSKVLVAAELFFLGSACFWLLQSLKILQINAKYKIK